MFDPTLALLDALLVPASARPAQNGAGEAAAGAFEALLAGLGSADAARPDQTMAPAPGAALPETGKPLPPDGKAVPPAVVPAAAPEQPDREVPVGDTGEPTEGQAPPLSEAAVAALMVATVPAAVPGTIDASAAQVAPRATRAAQVAPHATPPAAAAALAPTVRASAMTAPLATAPVRSASAPSGSSEPAGPADRSTATVASQTPATPVPTVQVVADPKSLAPLAAAAEATPQTRVGQAAPAGTTANPPPQIAASALTILPGPAQQAPAKPPSPSLRRASETRLAVASLAVWSEPSAVPVAQIAAPPADAPVSPTSSAPVAPVQPAPLPDHRALVEALVRARAERDPGVSVALETREFGAVALRFEALQTANGERGLQVALSSADPGFDRAVASAVASSGAAQAALADQSSRNPAPRAEPVPTRADGLGDAAGGRAASSDAQSQQRATPESGWREARARPSADPLTPSGDQPAAARPDRRRGSIFA